MAVRRRLGGWMGEGLWFMAMRCVGSTNQQALTWAGRGGREGLVIGAERQMRGRGRLGRRWVSLLGNAHCSMVLRPKGDVADYPQLSFVASLALLDALKHLRVCSRRYPLLECKWPNDVLLGGRKVAGLLLEATQGAVVLGVGINVCHKPKLARTTSLGLNGFVCAREDVIERFCFFFWQRYRQWQTGQKRGELVYREWMKHAYRLGCSIRVKGRDDYTGTFLGIAKDGRLRLGERQQERLIAAGDVTY